MKKPDRVEAGQWWRLTYSEMKEPVRLESTDIYGTMPVGVFYGGWSSASLILAKGEYLGSGEHPEPSEWMIETLAEHAYDIGRARLPPTWAGYPENKRSNWRYCARRTLSGESDILNEQLTDAMLSIYRILRSLGKW